MSQLETLPLLIDELTLSQPLRLHPITPPAHISLIFPKLSTQGNGFLDSPGTYITPAVDAFHFAHHGHPGVPVVAVLVVVLAELAVPGPVCLHHVAVLQAGGSLRLLRTLFAAVGGVAPHRVAARQHRARHLLTVNLSRRPLEMEDRIIFTGLEKIRPGFLFFPH